MEEEMRKEGVIKEATPEIVPSIIIGIGGTGYDIVRETKRRISKVYGDLPVIQYLVFDTDFKEGKDEIEEAEFIRLTVEHADDYIKGIENYPELKAWWPSDLYHIGEVSKGARQIRPIGRFALFRNLSKIRNIIKAREAYIKQPKHINDVERAGYSVKRDFKVFIVNSLGGGTGSGMFLDLAFNIRDVVKGCTINGYTILPSVFETSEAVRSRIAANTYASLKELEYYMNVNAGPEHSFNCNYSSVEISVNKKPFDYYYIIDTESEDHFINIKYKDVTQAIANSIFLDLTSSVGLACDALKNNIDLNLNMYLNSKNKQYLMAYASTGLYSIYYPASEIKEACVYRYAESLIDEIIRPIAGIDDIIVSSLNDITTRSEVKFEIADFESSLYAKRFGLPTEIGGIDTDVIEDDKLESKLSEWSVGEEKKVEGKISAEIKVKRGKSLEKVRNYLKSEIEMIVEDSSKGLAIGKSVIDELESFITAHLRELSGEKGEPGEAGQIAKSEKELKEIKELSKIILIDLKELIPSKFVLFKKDKIKKYRNAYLDKYVEYLNKYVDVLKEKEVKIFYTEVLNVLSDLRADLNNIERKLELLKKDLAEAKEKMLHRLHTESSYFQLEKWVGGTKENVERIFEKYEIPLKDAKNEVCQNVLYDWKDYNSENIRTALLRVSEMQYVNLRMNIIDVLPDLNATIKDVIEKARVQITESGIGVQRGFQLNKMAETVNILGVPEELRARVEDIVKKETPDPSRFRVVATKDKTRISNVIYKYVIPLMGMEPVRVLKTDYERAIETKERPLHVIESSNLEEII